jgi:hypothetical protein
MKLDHLVPVAALAGAALIAASFAWPSIVNRSWSEERAQRHAQTRAELHAATHAHSHAYQPRGDHEDTDAARAQELQARFDAELAELDSARNFGETGARVLWWLGAALVAAGGVLHLIHRSG